MLTNVKKNIGDNGKQSVHSQQPKQTWEKKENPEGVGSSKVFAAVDIEQRDISIPEKVLLDKDVTVPAQQQVTNTAPELVVLDNEVTASPQQHVTSTELAVPQNLDGTDLATATMDTTIEKCIAHDTSQMAIPHHSVPAEFADTSTFATQFDAPTHRTDRLPSTSLHVLEEISADENTGAAHCEIEQPSIVDVHHNPTDNMAAIEENLSSQTQSVQPEVHSSKNVQDDLDLWTRIREYDQRMADEGFTQVLSKS